jgi:hypothetical protein
VPLNIGWLGGELDDGAVRVRFYYDTTFVPVGDSQPLINGPRGFAMDVTNTTGRNVRLQYTVAGVTNDVTVAQGDPVTSGAGRSRTLAVLNNAGLFTRGDVGSVTIAYA